MSTADYTCSENDKFHQLICPATRSARWPLVNAPAATDRRRMHEIQFDRKAGTAIILTLADEDYIRKPIFAETAIQQILSTQEKKLAKDYLIPFRMDESRFTLEKMIRQLVDDGKIHAVSIRLKFKPSKKSSAVVYEYCADFDNCWGKLEIDLKKKTGKILTLAEGDTMKSNAYANTAIQKILTMETDTIPRKLTIPFRRW